MKEVTTRDKLKPSGHYSQAIIYNNTVYVSAQLPIDSHTGEMKHGSMKDRCQAPQFRSYEAELRHMLTRTHHPL